ncbi:pyrroline-5-carboxylate reductase isoform X3 [Fagus crenata]
MEAFPIPSDTYKLGFIGAGKMAESIARGVVGSGLLPPSRICTSHSNPIRVGAFESFGETVLPRNDDVVEDSDVVIFSVKPQSVILFCFSSFDWKVFSVKKVVSQLKPLLSKKKLLVSVAAGTKLKDLEVDRPFEFRFSKLSVGVIINYLQEE